MFESVLQCCAIDLSDILIIGMALSVDLSSDTLYQAVLHRRVQGDPPLPWRKIFKDFRMKLRGVRCLLVLIIGA